MQAAEPIAKLIVWLATIVGLTLCGGGIWLAMSDKFAATNFEMFGAKLSSTSIGVAVSSLGVIIVVMTFRRVLRALERLAALPRYP